MSSTRTRIQVPIYAEEFDNVIAKLGLTEVTNASVRVALGLKSSARKGGLNTEIKAKLKSKLTDATDEKKAEILKILEGV